MRCDFFHEGDGVSGFVVGQELFGGGSWRRLKSTKTALVMCPERWRFGVGVRGCAIPDEKRGEPARRSREKFVRAARAIIRHLTPTLSPVGFCIVL